MEITVETVTPKKAEAWLNANRNNRNLREGVAEQYAKDMSCGNWTQCTAPIAFYDDGDLADGQHRLYAIIESGTSQTFTIMRGLKRVDGLNIDTGLGRSLIDAGKISGLDTRLSHGVVSTARAVASGMASNGRMSNADKLAVVAEHREAAEWAVNRMPHAKNVCNSAVLAAVARAWYIETDHERLDKFCKVIGTGFSDGDADSAAIAMRNYMLAHAGLASAATMWRDTFLKVQNAIYYFMRRQRLTVIKSVKDEAYPLKRKRAVRRVLAAVAA
jgi:hypothetical protein